MFLEPQVTGAEAVVSEPPPKGYPRRLAFTGALPVFPEAKQGRNQLRIQTSRVKN